MMDKQLNCNFIFGMDDTSIKRMDTSKLRCSTDVRNKYLGKSNWYYQPKTISLTKDYKILINDLGIFCLTAWLLLFIAKFRKQRVYHWDHGWYGRETFLKKILKRLYFGIADGSLIYGDYAIRLMKENGFNEKKLFPIHNSLNYETQIELRKKITPSSIYQEYFGNCNPVLIMIGRLNHRKKISLLIEAIKKLKDKGELYNVILVGDGEERITLEEKVKEQNIVKQFWFYGACYDEGKNAELIYNADMCVVPGDIGLTAIHAMTFGLPVISHNYFPNQGPEFEVIKEGVTGSFFRHNDINSLTEVISNWFHNHHEDRDEIRNACYKEIEKNWTPKYQIKIIKEVINA